MKIIAEFLYGSHMYGTNTDKSDRDYICIVDEYPDGQTLIETYDWHNEWFGPTPVTQHLYTQEAFDLSLRSHDVAVLEVCMLHNDLPEDFKLVLWKLRKSFSTVANHSWVKGKKKLTVSADYDKMAGVKSIFHSMRILDYGIQIATEGDITDPKRMAWLMKDLYELADKYERDKLWEVIHSKYFSKFKELRHRFKINAPKQTSNKREMLLQVLASYGISHTKTEMIKQIEEIFEV